MTTTIVHRTADELASFLTTDRVNGHFGLTVAADEAVIAQTIDELLALSGDACWDYLAAQGYSEADLDNVSAMIMAWRGPAAHAELSDLAEKDCDADPAFLLTKWLDDGDRATALARQAASYEFPSPTPALCYAIVDAFVTARVALWMADRRRKRALGPPIDWSPASPEEREEDLLWAAAGYDEEVALWPEY